MKDTLDLPMFFDDVWSVDTVKEQIRENFIHRRKEMKLTQKQLSDSSGVSYASLRRFENTGEISLTSLLSLAEKMDCFDEFLLLFSKRKIIDLKKEFEEERNS